MGEGHNERMALMPGPLLVVILEIAKIYLRVARWMRQGHIAFPEKLHRFLFVVVVPLHAVVAAGVPMLVLQTLKHFCNGFLGSFLSCSSHLSTISM